MISAVIAVVYDYVVADGLYLTVVCLFISCIGSGLVIPILSRLTLESSEQNMGKKVTIFSLIRVFTGVIASFCTTLFFNNTLGSIASILMVFGVLAILLGIGLQHKLIKAPH